MQHFELSLNEEIEIYVSSGLTPTELFIIRLLFLAIDGDQKFLVKYIGSTSNGKEVLRSVLSSLTSKGIINSTFRLPGEGESLNFKNIPFNKNFIKRYIKESNELGKELFEEYPPFININGKMFSIKNFTKAGLFSMEDFCIFYAKAIKNASVIHERVLAALRYGKEHNLINYSILEFIASMKWIEIEHIQNSGDVNGYKNTELI